MHALTLYELDAHLQLNESREILATIIVVYVHIELKFSWVNTMNFVGMIFRGETAISIYSVRSTPDSVHVYLDIDCNYNVIGTHTHYYLLYVCCVV